MGVVRRAWIVLAGLGGCGGAGSFACVDDPSCSGGVCQPNGYCSFVDDGCPSGQRYGLHSPSGIAGECVEPGADTTDTSASATNPTTSATTLTTDATTATTGVAESSSTTPPMTDTTSAVDESSTSTGGDTGPSGACAHEEFDDDILENWTLWAVAPTQAAIVDGSLVVELGNLPSYGGIDPMFAGIEDGSIEVEMREAPNQFPGPQVFLGIGVRSQTYLLLLETGTLIVRYDTDGGFDNLFEVPWEPEDLWLRVVVDSGDLSFQSSKTGTEWEEIGVVTPEFSLLEARPFLHAGTWQITGLEPGNAVFERVSICRTD